MKGWKEWVKSVFRSRCYCLVYKPALSPVSLFSLKNCLKLTLLWDNSVFDLLLCTACCVLRAYGRSQIRNCVPCVPARDSLYLFYLKRKKEPYGSFHSRCCWFFSWFPGLRVTEGPGWLSGDHQRRELRTRLRRKIPWRLRTTLWWTLTFCFPPWDKFIYLN